MDGENLGNLEEDLLPAFTDHIDYHPSIDQTWYPIPQNGYSDSSFSSSSASYTEGYTPSSSGSFELTDFDGLSTRVLLSSYGSTDSVDITGMSNAVKYDPEYIERCVPDLVHDNPGKTIKGHVLWNYYDLYGDDVFEALKIQDDFSNLPGVMFNNPPELLFDDASSPLPIPSSPEKFVVPSQTFKSVPYRPKTPKTPQRALGDPPRGRHSQSHEAIKYFMSPREPQLQTPSSGLSSVSPSSTPQRRPLREPLQSSAALHRVQSIGSPRIIKSVKKTPSATSKIDLVAAGTFRCEYPGCKSVRGFKRHEHLKRHQRTHDDQLHVLCDFCPKRFPLFRLDNFKSHVTLHSENKPGSRTRYFPEAVLVVESWKRRKDDLEKQVRTPLRRTKPTFRKSES